MERLEGAELVVDPDPDSKLRSPFRTYMECLRRTPPEATHRLIVQDDAWPCSDFRRRVGALIAERPDVLIPLFVPDTAELGRQFKRGLAAGDRWRQVPAGWVPTVALVWPVEMAADYLAFAEQKWDIRKQRGDDSPVGVWRTARRAEAWMPIPSIVQHPDEETSLFRNSKGKAGRNRARVAVRYEE